MNRKLSLRKRSLKQLALKYSWSGTGQQDNPYIVDSYLDQYPTVSLTMCDTYIKLKNLNLNKLGINHCRNIVIENCKIFNLKLEGCKDIEIKNNSIMKLRSVFSRELIFEENAILEDSYTRLVSNYYEKITSTLIYAGTILGLIFMAQCLSLFIESKISMLLIFNTVIGFMFVSTMLYFLTKRLKLNNLQPNEYINFKPLSYEKFAMLSIK